VMGGRNMLPAMTMLVPPAWRNDKFMTPELRDFYEYHRCFNEPWDGPAALVFSDGLTVGACLDRNGLRPARYKLMDNGILSLGSEVGTVEFDDANVVEKGRLAPGEMIALDTVRGILFRDHEIKAGLAARPRTHNPVGRGLEKFIPPRRPGKSRARRAEGAAGHPFDHAAPALPRLLH